MEMVKIKLKKKDKVQLEELLKKGVAKTRQLTRARVLILSDDGKSPTQISNFIGANITTIRNIKERYLQGGLNRALEDAPRSGKPTRFSGKHLAQITALACTEPPEGHAKWSLRLLADNAVELAYVESISHTEVANILKKTKLNRTSKDNGASQK
jgi:putative transposase